MSNTYNQETQEKVWQQYAGNKEWAKDIAGAWICRSKYGDIDSIYGWEIDHKKPQSLGGTDGLYNLRPLHWRNNRSKGDSYPNWTSVVSSEGNYNINKEQHWKIN